ncbi:hypothetical protein DSO57_1017529 [Entomophthora muscae]|uniref:Uncharacterized protein n=1 Tax=Entomophthora muscae TaxID=34485 RepID=A0ACC2U2W9_9FUNG|nr:hypothetical protein DSO57_1017529 [Entomophthora muscae]
MMGFSLTNSYPSINSFAFPYGSSFYTLISNEPFANPKLLETKSTGARINPKVGGHDNDLIAFTRDKDIWVCKVENGTIEIPLTTDNIEPLKGNEPERRSIANGVAEYIIQEEFCRFTGFEWAPNVNKQHDGFERILYTCIDETLVDLITIPKSSGHEVDSYRYPRAGTKNASWELKVVEFGHGIGEVDHHLKIRSLPKTYNIFSEFPWAEYLVRFGWLPSGTSVWVQLLDRRQKHTAVVKIPLKCFNGAPDAQMEILFEEWSEFWINVTDVFYFFPDTADFVQMIWASESSGFRHLYLVTKAGQSTWCAQPITQGAWPVVEQPIFVDEARCLVYFSAKRESPLETHLYVACFGKDADAHQILRLTKPGASYTFTGDSSCRAFVEVSSSVTQLPVCRVVRPAWQSNSVFPSLTTLCTLKLPIHLRSPDARLPGIEFFRFRAEDGVEIHGMLIRPATWIEGHSYPTLVNIYGGPKIQVWVCFACFNFQMVTNDFKYPKLSRAYLAAKMGFVVVMIDGRGSSDRGLGFEGKIRHQLGELELRDQVEGIRYLTSTYGFIDAERIAITGWSYGGYLSLMALVRHPDVFKMAIAGAPVTNWNLYDSAYTERYLGLPHENYCGYHQSSVLSYIDSFPDSENRLLIAHGMIDENVHFSHTEALVSALISANKPYHLQVYPTERHGFRSQGVSEHFDTLMFYWLRNYL